MGYSAFIGFGFYKRALIPVVADVAIKGKLEAGLGGIVLIISSKGFRDDFPLLMVLRIYIGGRFFDVTAACGGVAA